MNTYRKVLFILDNVYIRIAKLPKKLNSFHGTKFVLTKHLKVKRYPCTGLDRSLGLQEVVAPRICTQSAHEGGSFISPTHRPPLPPKRYSWYNISM